WMARMALREGKWQQLNSAIDAMSEEVAQRDIWQYWKARASSQTGNKKLATQLYSQLAENATFYGFLSADQLNQEYSVFEKNNEDWENCAENVQIVSPIYRAMEWFELGKDSLAYKEWFWALKHMNKDGKLAAAALALKLDKPILAVRSVAKTKDWNQVGLRFPLLYKNLITEMSGQNGVNPAWVYGIMRRESVFNKKAVSGARAMGLMQLLPSTARYVGKQLGLARVRKSDLLTPKLNVKLGSAYLSGMLKDFDGSYVKATAGYNAGPSRSVKWTPKKTIDADQWVESIPFKETRKYVRAVMAYTTIYDHKLTKGKGRRISDRLMPVKARSIN
ncbi:MAG: transglycosylase SLT domain-containing protein, partial [Thiotrichaceae bacterium]